ncbi:MAG: hypothetical protein K2H18_06815 [Muribaculaceae bacterium]|nr:hypothetical protein [Muribaculaceae bacterium]
MEGIYSNQIRERGYADNRYRHVYAKPRESVTTPFGSRTPICYGDRLFARIVIGGRTVKEFILNQVCDMTELLGELRIKMKGLCGLAQIYIRNYTRGWSMDKPLMLYASSVSRRVTTSSNGDYPSNLFSEEYQQGAVSRQSERRMLCPWETH